jgi:hypothetical protein
MQQFKQNETTATYRRIYMFLANPADGYTPVTTLVGATVNLFKNGVAFGSQPTTPATLVHIQSGHWYYEMSATFLSDLGILTVTVQDTNIRPVVLMAQVVAFDPTASTGISAADVWTYGTRDLTGSVAVASIANNAITAASIADGAIDAATFTDSALVIGSGVGAGVKAYLGAGSITAGVIADAAIDAATFADSALVIGSGAAGGVKAYLGAGSITAGVVATGAIDADAIASDAITAAKIATGAIDADAIAADAITATVLSTDASNEIADALLNRNIGGGSSAGRLVKEALYALRNKSEIVGTTLSVYDAGDDLSWTATVASSASADPVTGIDP